MAVQTINELLNNLPHDRRFDTVGMVLSSTISDKVAEVAVPLLDHQAEQFERGVNRHVRTGLLDGIAKGVEQAIKNFNT